MIKAPSMFVKKDVGHTLVTKTIGTKVISPSYFCLILSTQDMLQEVPKHCILRTYLVNHLKYKALCIFK